MQENTKKTKEQKTKEQPVTQKITKNQVHNNHTGAF